LFSDRLRRRLLKGLMTLILLLPVFPSITAANPFLGSPEKKAPEPVRAAPTSPDLANRQMEIRNRMADLFTEVRDGDSKGTLLLLYGLSFLYGMLHAAGPGHRKTVVFSLFLSRQARWYEPLGMGLLLSLLHGGSAVLLLLVFRTTAGPLLSRQLNSATILLEGWAYSLLALLSLILLIGAVRHARQEETARSDGKGSLLSVAVSGIFPCPGAIMILLFSLTLDMLTQGITAVLIMSAGMALPVSLAGYLAYWGKKGLFLSLKGNSRKAHILAVAAETGGYTLLLIFSVSMALPFLTSLIG